MMKGSISVEEGLKNRKIILVFLTSIFLFSFIIAFEGNIKEFKTSPGKRLEIDLQQGGEIEITGWPKSLITVDVDGDEDYLDNLKFHYNNGNLRIKDSHFNRHGQRRLTLVIKVPEKFNIDVETMGGDVQIDNVEGSIEGETMGGELNFSNLKGTLNFSTMGGEVELKNSQVEGEVKTMGGEMTMIDVIGNIKGSTMGGAIHRINRNISKSDDNKSEVIISTMGGEIEVDSAPNGVDASTMGGEIYIGSAGKYVKAKTMGGEITIKEIDGWVKASTMGGEITVNMIGDPQKGKRDVDLSSMGGDITLTVPEGLSMEFDIELTYTKRSMRDYEIICDFPIKIEESESWDYSNGSPRKYIYGTGTVAGGKNRIKIETTNGNIRIKKGK